MIRKLAFKNLPKFNGAPKTWKAPSIFHEENMQELFYEGVPYRGKETRVFAWIGLPQGADEKHPVPGVVLVHGGLGTAFSDWIRLWNKQGFAAIAMDNCGGTPCWRSTPHGNPEWPRHEWSGPGGWAVRDIQESCLEDQWPFHAVASVLNGFELLRSLPQVDADRIGVTGISWGGYLTCIAASLEPRFRFAIPVYGCGGFKKPCSSLLQTFTEEQRDAWFAAWDPDLYLGESEVPFLWLTDAEDVAYPLDAWSHSASLTRSPLTRRSLRTEYVHDHTISWSSKTIPAYAKACLENRPMPELKMPLVDGDRIICPLENCSEAEGCSATLLFTRASGYWQDVRWQKSPATIKGNIVEAPLPKDTKTAFTQLKDANGCLWTSPVMM